MTDVNRIDLRLINNVWMAEYSGPYAEYMRAELGSSSAPTPFTGQTPASDVERAIQSRNPGFIVEAHSVQQESLVNEHFGKDCPIGKVQVEFVGAGDKYSEYGWKPTDRAFVEIYVDGNRFRIDIGDFHDGSGYKRGLHIVGPVGLKAERTALNACSVFVEKVVVPAELESAASSVSTRRSNQLS